ncbi:hypothetical protein [Aphanizomenon sp. UHCC 0183]|uniref:hypothetical protein n=1 Tax=Aphanizomenon sp. UHCC 0183 TaxID=2590028 RepID=UPI0014451B0C|nr:hypothetical protein [Aphanizomenon sp. UHCC 0183]MTJ32271.1 hypothetical protein [Aphanizomenon sp. UHCC 0183]
MLQKLKYWLVSVLLSTLWGCVIGILLQYSFEQTSIDYDMIPLEQFHWGIRYGLFMGTVIALSATIYKPSRLYLRKILADLLLVTVIIIVTIVIAAIMGVFSYNHGLWETSNWQSPNPRRHVMFISSTYGRDIGVILSLLAIAINRIRDFQLFSRLQ